MASRSADEQNDFVVGEGAGAGLVLWCFLGVCGAFSPTIAPELAQAGSSCAS